MHISSLGNGNINPVPGCAIGEEATEVSRAYGRLVAAEHTLSLLITTLCERLGPVMRPPGPEVACDKAPDSDVPLAMAMIILSDAIVKHNSRLGDIINRIEV